MSDSAFTRGKYVPKHRISVKLSASKKEAQCWSLISAGIFPELGVYWIMQLIKKDCEMLFIILIPVNNNSKNSDVNKNSNNSSIEKVRVIPSDASGDRELFLSHYKGHLLFRDDVARVHSHSLSDELAPWKFVNMERNGIDDYIRSVYNVAGFQDYLVVILWERGKWSYRYFLMLYQEKNPDQASDGSFDFGVHSNFSGHLMNAAICNGWVDKECVGPKLAISKMGDVVVVVAAYIYLSSVYSPHQHKIIGKNTWLAEPPKVDSIVWSERSDRFYFFLAGKDTGENSAIYQVNVQKENGTFNGALVFQHNTGTVLELPKDVGAYIVVMSLNGQALVFDKRNITIDIYEKE